MRHGNRLKGGDNGGMEGSSESDETVVYKIVTEEEWASVAAAGHFGGAAVDVADGFIHFSTAAQVEETAARHFAGRAKLLLVAVDARQLGPALRWEPSRGGALFPHLYAVLPQAAVLWTKGLPLGSDGRHRFPPLPGGKGSDGGER